MNRAVTDVAGECQRQMEGFGAGIGASLRGVDCAANAMAQAAFNRLFTTDGFLGPTLTIVLTIFIAMLGFALVTGRTSIGLSQLTPKMVTLVGVVTFATSWFVFQIFFYQLFVFGPDAIASGLMGTNGSATTIFADKLDAVMLSLMAATGPEAIASNTSIFSPEGLMWSGGMMLMLGTVGVLATTKIALAILMGLGPIFILCALFQSTRGMFTGWLKGVTLMALAPLFAVLGGSLMLELAIPVIRGMTETPGEIDVRAAMAFFMIGAVHLALMFMVFKVARTMVAGWTVFGLAKSKSEEQPRPAPAAAPSPYAVNPALTSSARDRAAQSAPPAATRDVRIAGATPVAANDSGSGVVSRETPIVGGRTLDNSSAGGAGPTPSRARGIGSRFKSAPIRQTENVK